MPLLHIISLAVIQGITEFLPISSSGHLSLTHAFLNESKTPDWNKQVMMDVAVHVGTLFAVLLYFRKDVIDMIKGLLCALKGKTDHHGSKLTLNIIIGSIPVIVAGFALSALEPSWLRAVEIVAWTTLLFGVLLWFADKVEPKHTSFETMPIKHTLLIGLAQCLALIPGTSRSGITMTASRFLGYDRTISAHFSLLLGIIAIRGAGTLEGLKLINEPNLAITFDIIIAAIIAFITGYIAIALMMKWLAHASFTPFVIYRIILGIGLLTLIYATDFL